MMPDRAPFISTQCLWRLRCPLEHQKTCLSAKASWVIPLDAERRPIRISDTVARGWYWQRMDDRTGTLAHIARAQGDTGAAREDFCASRLCLTIDAGVGKTVALQQIQYLRQSGPNEGCLALLVDFADLPTDVEAMPKYLAKQLKNSGTDPDRPLLPVWRYLQRLIRRGRFSLLVDSVDQTFDARNATASRTALLQFLQRYPQTLCVVAGRPYAIQRHWKLFDPLSSKTGPWEFLRIDAFTRQECEQYIGPERLAHLDRLGADVISIPRALEAVRKIPIEQLEDLRTKSDLYLCSLNSVIEMALRDQDRTIGASEANAWMLFPLLAFEMLRAGRRAGDAGIRTDKARRALVRKLYRNQRDSLQEALSIRSESSLEAMLGRLLAVNDILEDPVLVGRKNPDIMRFCWRNQTQMDLCAALWITRYADQPADFEWFHGRPGEEESREFCQLAVEMPLSSSADFDTDSHTVGGSQAKKDAFVPHQEPWVDEHPHRAYLQAIAPLYQGGRNQPKTERNRRWTEWLYRSWPNVLRSAGFLPDENWDPLKLREATIVAQRWAASNADDRPPGTAPARDLLRQFLGEFPRLCLGRGRTAVIARQLRSGTLRDRPLPESKKKWPKGECREIRTFVLCEPQEFMMGAVEGDPSAQPIERPVHSVRLSAFWLQSTSVTIAQYRLFDPNHGCPGSDDCPVTRVTWYDAWAFSLWIGGMLPTEAQWECACRAGAPIVSGCCDLSELTKHAWYKENSGGRCHPVATLLPNAWGLYDMRGNVWEWCGDWYARYRDPPSVWPIVDPLGPPTGKHRVRRGGSWNRRAEGCRPTQRYYGDPDIRYPIRLKAEEPRPERKNGERQIRYLIQGFRVCLPYDPPVASEAES